MITTCFSKTGCPLYFLINTSKRVFVGDIEFIVIDVVQEHIDTAKVVCRQVYFLSEKALPHVFFAENFCKLQQKRTRTASRIVNFIDFGFSDNRKPR